MKDFIRDSGYFIQGTQSFITNWLDSYHKPGRKKGKGFVSQGQIFVTIANQQDLTEIALKRFVQQVDLEKFGPLILRSVTNGKGPFYINDPNFRKLEESGLYAWVSTRESRDIDYTNILTQLGEFKDFEVPEYIYSTKPIFKKKK